MSNLSMEMAIYVAVEIEIDVRVDKWKPQRFKSRLNEKKNTCIILKRSVNHVPSYIAYLAN